MSSIEVITAGCAFFYHLGDRGANPGHINKSQDYHRTDDNQHDPDATEDLLFNSKVRRMGIDLTVETRFKRFTHCLFGLLRDNLNPSFA